MSHPRFDAMTREHVVLAVRTMQPKPIRKWSCMVPVNEKDLEFPMKQLFMGAANQVQSSDPTVTPADFTSHFAVARLKGLGFEVRYYG